MIRLPAQPLREVLVVCGIVTIGVGLLSLLRGHPMLNEVGGLGVAALFLWPPIVLAAREAQGLERFGIRVGGLLETGEGAPALSDVIRDGFRPALREAAFALLVAALVFPPFVVGFYFYHGTQHPFSFSLDGKFALFVLTQFVVVALTEEVFFRGYVWTRLHDHFAPSRRLGALFHPHALVVQSLLFAVVHVFNGDPAWAAVFFPGLLFGWIRARRGGVGAALVFHALSNILSEILMRGWMR